MHAFFVRNTNRKHGCIYIYTHFFQYQDDLLNFSKLEAGKVTLDLNSVYMEDLIADVIELLTILATQKGLNMTYIVDDAVPAILVGDSNRIKQ